MERAIERALIVEDDPALCAALARLVRRWGARVFEAHTRSGGIARLDEQPQLLVTDVRFPDGDASDLVREAASRRPAPVIVAMSGQASPEEAFRLGQLGVRAYVGKPMTVESFTRKVRIALSEPPDLEPMLAATVGTAPLREVQEEVRRVMVAQALALADGNASGAARLLGVSRQAIQQSLRPRRRASVGSAV